MKFLALFLSFFLFCWTASATSYGPPEDREVLSQNGKFLLFVDTNSKTHKIYSIDDRKKPLWKFPCHVWHFPFLISNDGKTVATVTWRYVQDGSKAGRTPIKDESAVVFWRKGKIWKNIKFAEFFPEPPKTRDVGIGPIGDSWRTWYSDLAITEEGFSLLLTNKKVVSFSFEKGAIIDTSVKNLFPVKKENELKVRYLPYDRDNDGIPNNYESKLGLGPDKDDSKLDLDKDGFSNLDEYRMDRNPLDAKDHPTVIYRCSISKIGPDSITIINHLNGNKVTMPVGKVIELKDNSNQSFKYKLDHILENHAIVICYEEAMKVKVFKEPRLKKPLKK